MTAHLWVVASLLAGLFQAWRTALQQRLRDGLTVSGAGLVRYACGLPFAGAFAGAYLLLADEPVPTFSAHYLLLGAVAGLAQILGTALLIRSFGYSGFVAGTAFSKTEALLAALGAAAFLSERLPLLAWLGIGLGVSGVMLLALRRERSFTAVLRRVVQPAALCGLGAAALFALTGLLVREATVALPTAEPVGAAVVTLPVVMLLQTVMHGAYVVCREPRTLVDIARNWRNSALVGALAAAGSACWFAGFAMAPVALVRIVGQVEVVFTVAFAHMYLAERVAIREVAALLLITGGAALALFATLA